jgi:hypothetical protein
MEILFRNPGSSEDLEIEYDDWKLTRYLDAHRATSFSVTCHRRVPVKHYAKITATDGGKTYFRGYVGKLPSVLNKTKTLTCYGDEELLLHRTTGRAHYFPDVTRLIHPFKSDPPNQVADEYGVLRNCGLLFLANSKIPDTIWTLEDAGSWTWKLPGGGSASRIGTSDIYCLSGVTAIKLTERASLDECKANDYSSYRTAGDLYIQINPVDEAYFGCILAANAFDTNVRMGQIDNPGTPLANLQMSDDKPAEVLLSLSEFYEQSVRFRYESDGYTYLDSIKEESEDAKYDLSEEECSSLQMLESNEHYVHALTGLGIGSRDCRHRISAMDLAYKGVWYQDNYEVDDGFGLHNDPNGLLAAMTTDEYNRRRQNVSWKASTLPSWPFRPAPGEYVNLNLIDDNGFLEATYLLRVESLSTDSKNNQVIELGRRVDDIIDAFNPAASLSNVYMYEYLKELYMPISINGDLQFGDSAHGLCGGFTGSVTIPGDVDDPGNNHRVTVDVSLAVKNSGSIIGPAMVYLIIGGSQSPEHVFKHYMIGDSISGIDITSKVAYGAATAISVFCEFQGNWLPEHSDCSGHPAGSCNLNFHMYKRTELV